MPEHEFRSSEPTGAPPRTMKPGECTPEAGTFACANCKDTVTATIILLEKDRELPLCHSCGPMARWLLRT